MTPTRWCLNCNKPIELAVTHHNLGFYGEMVDVVRWVAPAELGVPAAYVAVYEHCTYGPDGPTYHVPGGVPADQ